MTLSLPVSYSESVEPALVMVPLEPRVVVAVLGRGVGLTSTSLVVDYSVIIHKTAPTLQEIFGKLRCQVYGPYPMAYINYHHVTWRISDAIRYI